MAIDQKRRSLYCGLQAGLGFQEIDDRLILPLEKVPFELQDIMANWLCVLPGDLRGEVLYGCWGLTEIGWNAFVTWMIAGLHQAQWQPDFPEQAKRGLVQ